jgi:hypothetical protein
MKLKIFEHDGKQYAEVQDGKPVVIGDDEKEIAFDFEHTAKTISRLNGESKAQREAREAAEGRLRAFEGIEDAEAARKALETVANLKNGELVAAGQVEEIKAQARRAAEEQVSAAQKEFTNKLTKAERERNEYRDRLHGQTIGTAFAQSKFIGEKASIPADLMQARFGSAFKVEDGKLIAHHLTGAESGKPVYSRARPGEIADFDEALETLVDSYPYRDNILKGTGSSGSGARSGQGGGGSGSISRKAFDALTPMEQMSVSRKGTKIVD